MEDFTAIFSRLENIAMRDGDDNKFQRMLIDWFEPVLDDVLEISKGTGRCYYVWIRAMI